MQRALSASLPAFSTSNQPRFSISSSTSLFPMVESITHRVTKESYQVEAPPADAPLEVLNEYYWTKDAEKEDMMK